MSHWTLVVSGPAERRLAELTRGVAAAIVEFMVGPLVEEPWRVGKALQRELSGFHSARRGAYRIVYRIDPDARTVTVVRIDHRSQACRPR